MQVAPTVNPCAASASRYAASWPAKVAALSAHCSARIALIYGSPPPLCSNHVARKAGSPIESPPRPGSPGIVDPTCDRYGHSKFGQERRGAKGRWEVGWSEAGGQGSANPDGRVRIGYSGRNVARHSVASDGNQAAGRPQALARVRRSEKRNVPALPLVGWNERERQWTGTWLAP